LNRIVTIHQPDFMPWLGFFSKISKADEFIVLDHTLNNPKSPEFYCRRVKMLIGGQDHWMSIPLKKGIHSMFIPISDMEIQIDDKTKKKFLQSVELNYKKAPYFSEVFPLVDNYFSDETINLLEKNMTFIKSVVSGLNINTEIKYSSTLNPEHTSNEMLIDILKKRNATTYLCGDGANGYQEDHLYVAQNIEVKKNEFQHPIYNQFNAKIFIKGLSIVDALMNLGFDNTAELIRK
jgi:WbqC-like protein family